MTRPCSSPCTGPRIRGKNRPYLESESSPDLVSQDFGDDLVKGREDLHRQLRLDATLVDQIIESVGQRQTETMSIQISPKTSPASHLFTLHTCSHGKAHNRTVERPLCVVPGGCAGERTECRRGSSGASGNRGEEPPVGHVTFDYQVSTSNVEGASLEKADH